MKHRARTYLALAAVGVMALAASGCGLLGGAAAATAAATRSGTRAASSTASPYAQALGYANCMRAHGVRSWPDPNRSGMFDKSKLRPQQLGVGSSQIGAAQRACRRLYPNGPGAGPTPAQVQRYRSAMLVYAKCMRAHGIRNMPDPDSRGHLAIGPGTAVDVNTPQFQAARQACLSTLRQPAGARGNG